MSLFRHAREGHDPAGEEVVLVVEDDELLRAFLVTVIEERGLPVVAAGSGEEALAALGKQRARLAVLDIGLPGMDGFAVAEQLTADVPVIVVTGDPLKAKMRAYGRSSRLTILAKPITPERFAAAVQASL